MTPVLQPIPAANRAQLVKITRKGLQDERNLGIGLLCVLLLSSWVVPTLSPYSPVALVAPPLSAPSATHWFGTDELGRDIFVRVFAALNVDIIIIVSAVILSLVIGVAWGTIAGLSPAPVREAMQRVVDAVIAIPYLIFVLAIVAVARVIEFPLVPQGVAGIVIALVVNGWANYARITTAQVQLLARRESISAVRLLGYSRTRIIFRHLLPGVLAPTISLAGSHAVLITGAAAALSFLGAGVAPPTPELGAMMQAGTALLSSAWWVSVIPGVAIVSLALGFTLIADSRSRK